MAAETKEAQKRTDIDFAYFRKRLEDEKRLAQETIDGTRRSESSPTRPDNDLSGETVAMGTAGDAERAELSTADNHPADVATELFLREEDMALVQNAQDIIDKVNRALAKLDDGTYGVSDMSGEPIPVERLEIIPYATLTATEQEMQDPS